MGMTNEQFASFRRAELEDYEELLEIAENSNDMEAVVRKLKKLIDRAKKDVEK